MTWALILLYAASLGVDGYTTQKIGTRDQNPFARPFVSTRKGEALYSGLSLVDATAPRLIFKKHKKATLIWLGSFLTFEIVTDIRQVKLYRKYE